jgi:hypothetical protein
MQTFEIDFQKNMGLEIRSFLSKVSYETVDFLIINSGLKTVR